MIWRLGQGYGYGKGTGMWGMGMLRGQSIGIKGGWAPTSKLITNQRIRMRASCDDSSDFSKYFTDRPLPEDKSLYNYSHNNETLLLETTDIPRPKHPSILEDLYEQLEVTLSKSQVGLGAEQDLQEMCHQLLGALQKLESKVDRMEEQEKGRLQKQSRGDSRVESVATLSTRGSKCRCDDRAMGSLLELVEQRSKVDVYRQEKETLQRQVVRLEVANEDLRKQVRKLQGENLKVKELLRQSQQANRKQTRDDYEEEFPHQDAFRPTHTRCCTLQDLPEPGYRSARRNEKENIKLFYQRKMREEEVRGYPEQAPTTPNPLLRTKPHPLQTTNTKIASPCQPHRPTQISQRVQRLLDMDNLKTESKSRDGRGVILKAFSRCSPRHYREELLEQEEYHLDKGKQFLEPVKTMTSLPDSPSFLHAKHSPSFLDAKQGPSFFDLKRMHSSHSLLGRQEHLSPLRSLPKANRR